MTVDRLIQISQNIQILSEDDQGDAIVTRVSEGSISVRFPKPEGRSDSLAPESLRPGAQVKVRVATDKGLHTGTATVVSERPIAGSDVVLTPPKDYVVVQKRKFFRVAISLPVTCKVVASANKARIGKTDAAAQMGNLSAGGMLLHTTLPVEAEDKLELVFKVVRPDTQAFKLIGRVTRAVPVEGEPLSVGIEFAYSNRRDEDAMMRVMFELQRQAKNSK